MSTPDPTPSRDALERARAYVRVDQRIVAALPELSEAELFPSRLTRCRKMERWCS
jgi:hypothetical protein